MRYTPQDNVDIDVIWGHNITGENAHWLTLGINFRFYNSVRTIRAPATIACIFPNATSWARYFMPQSGATTMRSAGT